MNPRLPHSLTSYIASVTRSVCLLVLACVVSAQVVSAQNRDPDADGSPRGFSLGQNYPNPFRGSTTIPFVLESDLFGGGGEVLVSARVFNLLQEPVGAPIALRHAAGAGVLLSSLAYSSPGRYEARWDDTDSAGNPLSSGTYLVQLTVNGVSRTRKMLLLR